ncbi:hypothetical protein HJA90_29505, partial [Rhizobium bangladeshense]|nr:hypothetical protein [Rhizobium bangladeshense]
MCRRIYVDSSLDELVRHFSFAGRETIDVLGHRFPRYNGFPREVYPIIIRDNSVGMPVFKTAVWDFTQARMKPARRPSSTNVSCEGIDANDRFGPAYRARRCLIPVKGYVDWNGDSGNGKRLQRKRLADGVRLEVPWHKCLELGYWPAFRDAGQGLGKPVERIDV